MVSSALQLSPVERLSRTQGLWLLDDVTREEAARLLGDKEEGNFLVRKRQKPGTKALSIRTRGQVQHFILIRGVNCVFLEDSDLKFDSLVSLLFHYSTVREELPCLLTLPTVLATAESTQGLDSLSLLGKRFWNYPMSKPGRRSLLLADSISELPTINKGSNSDIACDLELAELSRKVSQQLEKLSKTPVTPVAVRSTSVVSMTPLTSTPPRPPRRSLGGRLDTPNTSPLSSPIIRQKQRRVSDSAVTSCQPKPTIASHNQRHSVSQASFCPSTWQASPLYPMEGKQATQQRKGSVFMDRLAEVEESVMEMNSALNGPQDTQLLSRAMSTSSSRQSSNKPMTTPDAYPSGTLDSLREFEAAELRLVEESGERVYTECEGREEEGEGDYAEPVDRIPAPMYSCVGEDKRDRGTLVADCRLSILRPRHRVSEGNLQYHASSVEQHGKRKLSLGVMIRKLSQGKERRLSSVLQRLSCVRPLGSTAGHQTDSSSWEFLSCDGKSASSSPSSTGERRTGARLSSDSVYDSDYDSSARSSLNRQSDSAFSSLTPSDSTNRIWV